MHEVPGAREVLVIIHGLGGDHDSYYAILAARAAAAAGVSSLRLSLRGAIAEPKDLYHAGLSADVHAACRDETLQNYADIYLLGYSMGGNLVLGAGTETDADPRLRAIAASCAPVDLDACCRYIDEDAPWLYRRWILDGLKTQYRRIARHSEVPIPPEEADRIGGFRDWDGLTVAPRFGFASAADYYQRMSAAHRVRDLRVPALLVQSRHDPIVEAKACADALGEPPPMLTLRWVDGGGHLGLPAECELELGEPPPSSPKTERGFEAQALSWLRRQQ